MLTIRYLFIDHEELKIVNYIMHGLSKKNRIASSRNELNKKVIKLTGKELIKWIKNPEEANHEALNQDQTNEIKTKLRTDPYMAIKLLYDEFIIDQKTTKELISNKPLNSQEGPFIDANGNISFNKLLTHLGYKKILKERYDQLSNIIHPYYISLEYEYEHPTEDTLTLINGALQTSLYSIAESIYCLYEKINNLKIEIDESDMINKIHKLISIIRNEIH